MFKTSKGQLIKFNEDITYGYTPDKVEKKMTDQETYERIREWLDKHYDEINNATTTLVKLNDELQKISNGEECLFMDEDNEVADNSATVASICYHLEGTLMDEYCYDDED